MLISLAAFVHPRPFFCTRHRTMADQQDTRTREELLAALQAAEAAREAAEAQVEILRCVKTKLDKLERLHAPLQCCGVEAH